MPRRTSSPIRSAAPGPPSSSTARSQAASSRDTAAPAAATTPPSFERNNRSRVASSTRLAIEKRHVDASLKRRRLTPKHVPQPQGGFDDQDGVAHGGIQEAIEDQEHVATRLRGDGDPIRAAMPRNLDMVASDARDRQHAEETLVDLPKAMIQ